MKNRGIIRILRVVTVVFLIIYAIATYLKMDGIYNTFSPLTVLSAAFLIVFSYANTGRSKRAAILFIAGMLTWFVSDLLWSIILYANMNTSAIEIISDNLYLIPEVLFTLGILMFWKSEFPRRIFYNTCANALAVSVVGYVFINKIVGFKLVGNGMADLKVINNVIYFITVIFTIVFIYLCTRRSGLAKHTISGYMVFGAMLIYNGFELRYAVMNAMGQDAESIYIDLVYMLCMVLYSLAFSNPELATRQPKRLESEEERDPDARDYSMWINALGMFVLGMVLFFMQILTSMDFYIVLTTVLMYLIICKSIESNEIYTSMMEKQRTEKERLEELVRLKTSELERLNKYLDKVSNVDALTELYNRRYCSNYIFDQLHDRKDEDFAIFQMDLNFFKHINDNYGHDVGDFVLKEAASRIKKASGDKGVAFRMGGDEFLVISTKGNREQYERIAKDICRLMDDPIHVEISREGESIIHDLLTSVTVGVAEYPKDGDNFEDIIKCGDEIMYDIKHKFEKSCYIFWGDAEGHTA